VKKALAAAAILLVLVAGGIFWAYHSIDVIVKMALERYGPDVLGVPVSVSDVRISAKTGEGSLKNLEIGSPRGFSAARAAQFGEIRVAIEPLTITEPVVAIREIVIDAPLITYERGKSGTNLDAIQKNIDAYVRQSGGSSEASGAGKPQSKRRFTIDRLVIRGARVTMTNPALKGQGIAFDLPEVQLANVGKRQGGLRASEVASVVAGALISRIAQKLLTNLDLLRKGGVEGAVDALKGLLK
jgi:hypothetical protein